MIAITAIAPAIAATDTATSPKKPKVLNAVPAMLPDRRIMKATPRLAPELIPSSEGPARGLRNTVCICNPLMDKPAPATKAVSVWGKRDFQIIFCHISGSSPVPDNIFQIEPTGMEIVPNTRLSMKNSRIETKISISKNI
jgi:hypothetical protein